MMRCPLGQLYTPTIKQRATADEECVRTFRLKTCKCSIDVLAAADLVDPDLQSNRLRTRLHLLQRALSVGGLGWIDQHREPLGCGHYSRSNSSRFAASSVNRKFTP